MSYVIWHNPRCSKSRATLAILRDAGVDVTERLYRDVAPTVAELDAVARALDVPPQALVRMGEGIARELGLAAADLTDQEWLQVMAEHPILIERPIVVAPDGRAVLGRPPETVRALL
jgi:arsenate reductase